MKLDGEIEENYLFIIKQATNAMAYKNYLLSLQENEGITRPKPIEV